MIGALEPPRPLVLVHLVATFFLYTLVTHHHASPICTGTEKPLRTSNQSSQPRGAMTLLSPLATMGQCPRASTYSARHGVSSPLVHRYESPQQVPTRCQSQSCPNAYYVVYSSTSLYLSAITHSLSISFCSTSSMSLCINILNG